MAKRNLVSIIGKLFVDEKFRKRYYSDRDATLKRTAGLTAKEKNFLIEKEAEIRRFVQNLEIKYKGEDKRK